MRLRNIIIYVLCLTLVVAFLIAAGSQLDYINTAREEMKLISNEPLKNAPPSLAFATVAMGSFRGLIVDVLWIRADRLKEKGQFFDAKQLAEWITTLQPRFASVWQFQAWNMAYNISVSIPASQPEERWRWIKNGIELLRDQGIVLNPRNISLYRELAWIFQHKISGISDDVHKYYKLQLASAMEPLLGSADNEYFQALADTPKDWQNIIADPNIKAFVKTMKSADKAFENDNEFVNNYLSLRQNPQRYSPKAFEVIDVYRSTKALKKFHIFAKAYHLRRAWKLDPVLMNELNQTYGPIDYGSDPNKRLPLDWRHPDCHAIYWAVKGLQTAGKEEYSLPETNTDRIVAHSLQNLFRNGKMFIYDIPPKSSFDDSSQSLQGTTEDIYLRQDLRMFESYHKSIIALLEKYKDRGATYEALKSSHKNMLTNAIFSFYQAGHMPKARSLFRQLREHYPEEKKFKKTLEKFVRQRLKTEFEALTLNNASEMVQNMLRESYFRYALRDDDEAFGREEMAKEAHNLYQSMYNDENRINLPDFKLLRYFALIDFLNDGQYPLPLRISLRNRIRVERPDLAKELEKQEEALQRLNQQQEQK
ncbi:MAG: hypothetical protein ACYSSI_05900 [Planctomycetota bacterium]|jgi:hypothetical protein